MPTLLCAGFGYSARALAALLIPEGWRVIGTHRAPEGAGAVSSAGAEPALWPPAPDILRSATHLLVSAAPDEAGDPTLRALGPHLSAPPLEWVGYLSTTGVYGDRAGGWVDDRTEPAPTTKRGEMRVAAEAEWRATGLPLMIFRLAGIYGPGRGPFEKVRDGTARRIIKPGQVFSRIHRDDIAAALRASIARPDPGAVYNLCDDDPAPPEDVIAHAADLLGLPLPPAVDYETAELSPMARSFYSESKRVSNARTKERLGLTLRHPTYREGLAAILEEEGGAPAQ
ncbi:MAG: SDR family oxidoreductase [Pikeienuella sp.]|uniref:SDR family oxidoreductase n=1 Tax=Pikeienuella sp. TaxID=2831957 RepID=UPI00391B734A